MAFWDSVKNWISGAWNSAKNWVGNTWNNTVKPFLGRVPVIGNTIVNGVEGLGNAINHGADAIGHAVNGRFGDAINSASDAVRSGVGGLSHFGLRKGGVVQSIHSNGTHHLPKNHRHTFQK